MASQQVSPAGVPPAPVVGNAFVHQYYNVLHQSPQMVHRFYQDSSKLGRPDPNGEMSTVTTMAAIHEKIMSLDSSDCRAEIKTVDSQESYNLGVLVLVTGSLTGKNNVKRNFTQSFFLAPQDKGYFVLNDVFRYLEEAQQPEPNATLINGVSEPATKVPPMPEPVAEPAAVQELHAVDQGASQSEEEPMVEEVYNPSDHEDGSVVEDEAAPAQVAEVVQNEAQPSTEAPAVVQEEAPKKSYASIVKVMKENATPVAVQTPSVVRTAPPNVDRQTVSPTPMPPATESSAPAASATEISNSAEAEADGRSIYIKNLPLTATAGQLDEEFRKFGSIKAGGIQVRSNKQQGFCYGFVEFEASSSMQSAIEASPITIGGRQAYVEEKRPAGNRVPRGRFPPGRGGFRNDGMRGGRGGYGGRGYGRNDFTNRGDFSNRGRGSASGRGGTTEGYQRVDQIGNGSRGARASAGNQMSRSGQRVGSVTA
eukprot:Gb_35692 [translate_table: standard]